MTPVFANQLETMLHYGRAFKACIATLLDVAPKDFPEVEGDILKCPRMRAWLSSIGYHWVIEPYFKDMHRGAGVYECILIGYGSSNSRINCVIARSLTGSAFDWEIIHDPSEGAIGMKDVLRICYLIPTKFTKVKYEVQCSAP